MLYLTKYALSGKIALKKERDRAVHPAGPTWVYVEGGYTGFLLGRDIHKTAEAAVARANGMRTAKIASLKKQIAKLEKLVFEAPSQEGSTHG